MVVKHTYKPRNENGGVLTKSWGRERGQQADGRWLLKNQYCEQGNDRTTHRLIIYLTDGRQTSIDALILGA